MPETAIQLIIHTTAPSCLTFLPYFALLCHILPSCHILPYFALICPIFPYLAISRHLGSIQVLCSNCSGSFYELHQIVSVLIQRSTLILPYLLSDGLQAASCQFRNEGEEEGSGLHWPGSMEWGSEMADVHCCTPLWTALHEGNIYPAMPCYLSLCNQKVKSDQFAPQRQNIAKL